MKIESFPITIRGVDYSIDIVRGKKGEVDIFVEYDSDDDIDVPEDEVVFITYYLIEEGFVKEF